MSGAIQQQVTIAASPGRVYQALLDSRQFSAVTGGAPAEIDARPGGAFTAFGGMITGRNIELVLDRRVVQAWRVTNWPDGVYSIVRFELEPLGTAATKLTLHHIGFPEDAADHLASGWPKMYWEPLKKYLA